MSTGITNLDKTKKAVRAKTKVNLDVDVKMKHKEPIKKCTCMCCGKEKSIRNFNQTKSPLFKANDGYYPLCKDCRNEYYLQMVELFDGNEAKAIERMCQLYDWYFGERIFASTYIANSNRPRINSYPAKMNLKQDGHVYETYVDTIKLKSIEEQKEGIAKNSESVKERTRRYQNLAKKFGSDHDDHELDLLEEHYQMLTQGITDVDSVQYGLIKDLCETKLLQIKARKDMDIDRYDKLTQLYQKTLKTANIKLSSGVVNTDNDAYGVWLSDIEKNSPADYYKDKLLFKDFFGIKEYVERLLFRPLKNLLTGSKEMDNEYSIQDDEV